MGWGSPKRFIHSIQAKKGFLSLFYIFYLFYLVHFRRHSFVSLLCFLQEDPFTFFPLAFIHSMMLLDFFLCIKFFLLFMVWRLNICLGVLFIECCCCNFFCCLLSFVVVVLCVCLWWRWWKSHLTFMTI